MVGANKDCKLQKVKEKINEHKAELVIIGSVVAMAVVAIVLTKEPNKVKNLVKTSPQYKTPVGKVIMESTPSIAEPHKERITFHVNAFVRRLPKGHKASDYQRPKAEALGMSLIPNETFVDTHERSRVA